ncbi:glycosyltransferase family 2 protein [Persephonella atlantica]|uniref:Glycosyltransferase family 2 protein n=1 Tax=Persephonella atlantica TaxID=2699429 RepID=A0ABS1GJT8_9AQUI|nr:glycosyltransferase family 2 protein [Persephonella atlantica]MBK3333198.1 glycosyltransferase family 2 protein [Persephonella atlantica]
MLNKNKLVSILIPVYNREKYIEETVKSALNQTYRNIEVIIVDNKSTDNTWKILKKLAKQDSRLKIFQNETNIGPVRNWKRCIDEASGEYGKILWSDDLITPDFIEKTLHYIENKDVGFVITGTKVFTKCPKDGKVHVSINKSGIYNSEEYIKGILYFDKYPVSPGCALFRLKDLRKNLLINIPNKINIDFSMHAIGNDLLIYLLTANQYPKFAFVKDYLSFFRAHPDSISIKSNKCRLIINYSLALSYFIEKYRSDLIRANNTRLYLVLKKCKKLNKEMNLKRINDFYMKNTNAKIDFVSLVKMVKNILIRKFNNFKG